MSGFGSLTPEEVEEHFPEFSNGRGKAVELKFRTAREIAEATPERPEWVCEGLVACGAITELDGAAKLAGKTTFVASMVRQVLNGQAFMGRSTLSSPVIWLTEERDQSFRETLVRAGLDEEERLWVLEYHQTTGLEWRQVMEQARRFCAEQGARLCVIDTLPAFANLRDDRENQAGAALEAMGWVSKLAADRIGVLCTRHDRRQGGSVGESARGSSAFTGAVDIVLQITRSGVEGAERQRILSGVGRFDEVPEKLTIELVTGGYRELGATLQVKRSQAAQLLLRHLPKSQPEALPFSELLREGQPLHECGVSRATLYRAASQLHGEGALGNYKSKGLPASQGSLWWVL